FFFFLLSLADLSSHVSLPHLDTDRQSSGFWGDSVFRSRTILGCQIHRPEDRAKISPVAICNRLGDFWKISRLGSTPHENLGSEIVIGSARFSDDSSDYFKSKIVCTVQIKLAHQFGPTSQTLCSTTLGSMSHRVIAKGRKYLNDVRQAIFRSANTTVPTGPLDKYNISCEHKERIRTLMHKLGPLPPNNFSASPELGSDDNRQYQKTDDVFQPAWLSSGSSVRTNLVRLLDDYY
ncbi:hypothetical protein L218DRAFT_958434, partial [Marasmius fiardii PR-910]